LDEKKRPAQKYNGKVTLYSGYRRKYDEVKRLAEDRDTWRKMTHQPADTEDDR